TAMDNWSDGYGVLRGLTIPGCISEGSMHDYIPETYRLMNSDYKWLEAWHFLKTFSTYFAGKEIPTGNIVGKIHDSHNKNEASYAKIPNSHDIMLPLNKVKVTLNPGNKTYETDNMDNGIYVFKDLLPGTYSVKFEADVYYSKEFTVEVKQNMTSYQNVALDKIRITPPEVISHSPNVAEDQIVLCSTPIVFDFNWDIDEESAMNAFSIIPEVTGDFTFEDSSHRMIFTPRVPYNTSTRYTVTLDKSLKHPGNICMENDFVFSFFTADRNRLALIKGYPSVEHTQVNYEKPVFFFVFDRPLDVTGIKDAINVYN
ncbi:MAG: Ig-like domain-containing protein, partial [Bacteroidales bacterium]